LENFKICDFLDKVTFTGIYNISIYFKRQVIHIGIYCVMIGALTLHIVCMLIFFFVKFHFFLFFSHFNRQSQFMQLIDKIPKSPIAVT